MSFDPDIYARGLPVRPRTGKMTGRLTGGSRGCAEGCRGRRLGVRWPDGQLTWPCTKGMTYDAAKQRWKIL